MPLLKKAPFALMASPEDLKPNEKVWQIRFTGEIFRDYSEYLNRLNLFRQRTWTCCTTGKMHLTYEEALVSEQQANARVQHFPEIFKAFVLQNVQFSTLKINELVNMIIEKLKNSYVEGEELLGKLEDSFYPCKITKLSTCKGGTHYEVDWLSECKKLGSTLEENELCRKKIPFTKDLLKLFIRESTFHNNPWIVRNSLVKLYGLTTNLPPELADKIAIHAGVDAVTSKKLKENIHPNQTNSQTSKTLQKENQLKIEKIVYPIEDLLVKPSADDTELSARPVPSTDFFIPINEVGNLLMVWNFLSCFGKILRLSPFSLSDFEEAVIYNGVSSLIVEAHVALLTLLIEENEEFNFLIQQREKEEKIALNAWEDYLCDFLEEMDTGTEFTTHIVKIKNGKYFSLHVHDKLEIFTELLQQAMRTEPIKWEVDECIEKQLELKAMKREEDLEEARKKREEKRLKKETDAKATLESINSVEKTTLESMNNDEKTTVEYMNSDEKPVMEVSSITPMHQCDKESKLHVLASRRAIMVKNLALEKEKEFLKKKELHKLREESKAKAEEARERNLKRKRNELFELEMEKLHIWPDSLGKDRDYNMYWFFKRDGRLFVQSLDDKNWGFYSSKEELDSLISSLNPKGVRELALKNQLEKRYTRICDAFQKRSRKITRKAKLEDTSILRRSVRVSAPQKNEQDAPSFLKYVNALRK